MPLTLEDVEVMAARVLASRRSSGVEFMAGVRALASALKSHEIGKHSPLNPWPGMWVRVRRRRCDLEVNQVTPTIRRTSSTLSVGMTIHPHNDFEHRSNDPFRPRRRMWLSTWRRWSKSGKLIIPPVVAETMLARTRPASNTPCTNHGVYVMGNGTPLGFLCMLCGQPWSNE